MQSEGRMNLEEAKAKWDEVCDEYVVGGAKPALDAAVKDVALAAVERADFFANQGAMGGPVEATKAEIERLFGKGE